MNHHFRCALRSSIGLLAGAVVMSSATEAAAVRPFITDDARVVGGRLAQLESWARFDRESYQQWALVAFGPVEPLELTVGAVGGIPFQHDGERDPERGRFSVAGPVLQAKALLRETRSGRWFGIAIAGGVVAPAGVGAFKPMSWDPFAYLALSQSFLGDDLLIHVNLGSFVTTAGAKPVLNVTWGIATQVRTLGGLHAVAEVFSGDPYASSGGGAYQAGFRYIFSDQVQVDATVGTGLWGAPPLPAWGSVGVRLVTGRLW